MMYHLLCDKFANGDIEIDYVLTKSSDRETCRAHRDFLIIHDGEPLLLFRGCTEETERVFVRILFMHVYY